MDSKEFTISAPDPPIPEQIEVLWKNGGCIALAKAIAASIREGLQLEEFGDIIERPATIMVEERVS